MLDPKTKRNVYGCLQLSTETNIKNVDNDSICEITALLILVDKKRTAAVRNYIYITFLVSLPWTVWRRALGFKQGTTSRHDPAGKIGFQLLFNRS